MFKLIVTVMLLLVVMNRMKDKLCFGIYCVCNVLQMMRKKHLIQKIQCSRYFAGLPC